LEDEVIPNNSIHQAAQTGDCTQIASHIQSGVDVNEALASAGSPLGIAAQRGHLDAVDLLIVHRADLNAADGLGNTPFFRAVAGRHLKVAQRLRLRGADVNTPNLKGMTPIFYGTVFNDERLVQYLCNVKADINVATEGDTPIEHALAHNFTRVEEVLRAAGAVSVHDPEPEPSKSPDEFRKSRQSQIMNRRSIEQPPFRPYSNGWELLPPGVEGAEPHSPEFRSPSPGRVSPSFVAGNKTNWDTLSPALPPGIGGGSPEPYYDPKKYDNKTDPKLLNRPSFNTKTGGTGWSTISPGM